MDRHGTFEMVRMSETVLNLDKVDKSFGDFKAVDRFSAEFKRKVILEAMRGDGTVGTIATRNDINPNQVSKWKAEAHEGLLECDTAETVKV